MHVAEAGNVAGWLCNVAGEPVKTVCSWTGVNCVNGVVSEIHLSGLRLAGSIPRSLALVSTLSVLDLTSNQLTGSLPVEYCQAAQLQTLAVTSNALTCYTACANRFFSSYQLDSSLLPCSASPTAQPVHPSYQPSLEPSSRPSKWLTCRHFTLLSLLIAPY